MLFKCEARNDLYMHRFNSPESLLRLGHCSSTRPVIPTLFRERETKELDLILRTCKKTKNILLKSNASTYFNAAYL